MLCLCVCSYRFLVNFLILCITRGSFPSPYLYLYVLHFLFLFLPLRLLPTHLSFHLSPPPPLFTSLHSYFYPYLYKLFLPPSSLLRSPTPLWLHMSLSHCCWFGCCQLAVSLPLYLSLTLYLFFGCSVAQWQMKLPV